MADNKRKAMGKGLAALLKDPSQDIQSAHDERARDVMGAVAELDVNSIETNPFQPRTHFNEEALEELAHSIRELGVIQPITVRKVEFGKYQLISGERRFRASKMAGLKSIPAYIRLADDQNMLEMALVENIQRQDLDAIEVALSYQRLIEECSLTQEQMSERVGKKRSTVTNYLRLLRLPPLVQAGIRDQMISMGHARTLVNVPDETTMLSLYREIIEKDLSVRQIEDRVRRLKNGRRPEAKPGKVALSEDLKRLNRQLTDLVGSKVQLSADANGGGKITIPFGSEEDLERILERLMP